MLKKRILASSMASVMALSSVSVAAFAEDLDMEDTVKKYNEAVTKDELKAYYDSLKDFVDDKLDNYGTVQGEYFSTTYSHAEQVLDDENSTDKDYTAAYQMLKAVKDNLVIKTADQLKSLIADYKKTYDRNNILNDDDDINDYIYTEDSFETFKNAYDDAEFYVDSESSRDITDAYMALESAFGALEDLSDVTKSEFTKAMREYKSIQLKESDFEAWRRGEWDGDDGTYGGLFATLFGKNKDDIDTAYDTFTRAKNVSRTTEPEIVKAYKLTKKLIGYYDSWKADKNKSGNKNTSASLVNKTYHNRLVEQFNPGLILDIIGIEGTGLVNPSHGTVANLPSKREATRKIWGGKTSESKGTNRIFTYNKEKHTLTVDKEVTLVKVNAKYSWALGSFDEVDISSTETATNYELLQYMFDSTTAAQDWINATFGDANKDKYTTQKIGANMDILQYLGFNHRAEPVSVEDVRLESVELAESILNETTGENDAPVFVDEATYTTDSATSKITKDTSEAGKAGSAKLPAAYAAAFVAETTTYGLRALSPYEQLVQNIKTTKKGQDIEYPILTTTSTDQAIKDKVAIHNDAVARLKVAFDSFIKNVKRKATAEQATAAQKAVKAVYDNAVSGEKFLAETVDKPQNYNPVKGELQVQDESKFTINTATADYVEIPKADMTAAGFTSLPTGVDTFKFAKVTAKDTTADGATANSHNTAVGTIITAYNKYKTAAGKGDAVKTAYDATDNGELFEYLNPLAGSTADLTTDAAVLTELKKLATLTGTTIGGGTIGTSAGTDLFKVTGKQLQDIFGTDIPAKINGADIDPDAEYTFVKVTDVTSDASSGADDEALATINGKIKDHNDKWAALKSAVDAYNTELGTNATTSKVNTEAELLADVKTKYDAATDLLNFSGADTVEGNVSANPFDEMPGAFTKHNVAETATVTMAPADALVVGALDAAPEESVKFYKVSVKSTVTDPEDKAAAEEARDDHNEAVDALNKAYEDYKVIKAHAPAAPAPATPAQQAEDGSKRYNQDLYDQITAEDVEGTAADESFNMNSLNKLERLKLALDIYYEYDRIDKDKQGDDEKFEIADNREIAEAILDNVLTVGGKTIPEAKGSTAEWTLVWRYLKYALEDNFDETSTSSKTLKELKKLIDDSQDLLDKTADAALFSTVHNALLDQTDKAMDWYQEAKATTGWKSGDFVESDFYSGSDYPKGAQINTVYNQLNSKYKTLKAWFECFKYSYEDIRVQISEIATAIEKGEVKDAALTKKLYECSNLLATLEASDITDSITAEDNAVFDDEGMFQPNNRLKTNEDDDYDILDPNAKEEKLLKSFEDLKDLFKKAQGGTADTGVAGDVDGNTKFETSDVTTMIAALMDMKEIDAKANKAYDMNGDEKFTIADVTAAITKLMG